MPPDAAAVDTALVQKLSADTTLAALMPDGVFFDQAPPGATRFVILSIVEHHDEPMFHATAFEEVLYSVEARALSTSGGDVKSAAARIHELLHNGTLNPTGYTLMCMRRSGRDRRTELDEADLSIRWLRRGGRYEVMVTEGQTYDGLIRGSNAAHYWRLNAPSGATAYDVVGGADGTISGGVTHGQPGALASGDPAMTFNGTTGQIVTVATITIPTVATIEAWIKSTDVVTGRLPILSMRAAGNTGLWNIDLNSQHLHLYRNAGGEMVGTKALCDGNWHHVVVVFAAAGASRLYVDGVVDPLSSGAPVTLTVPAVGRAAIGFDEPNNDHWAGTLDEVAIYPFALTAADISAHYAARLWP